MANYSRWDDVKKKRREPTTETRAGVEQDLALGQLIYDLRTEAGISQRELAERIPAAHLDFFRGLPLSHVEGDYIFVHAGLRPGIPIARQRGDDMMWIRDEFLYSDEEFGKLVVHGHSISETPQIRPNRIGIDTGAFATGRLTCLVLEGTERAFLTS